jgi:hypothetical protein
MAEARQKDGPNPKIGDRQMVTPSSAHPDEMKTPDHNLLIDIDFDPPCVVNDKREVRERRPRDTTSIKNSGCVATYPLSNN